MSVEYTYSGSDDHQAVLDEMVSFGDGLVSAGHMEEALKFFRRVVRIYPESDASYARLGELYMKRGDGERARKNFARSLELRPDNPDVVAKLSLLGGAS